jgi:AcrR family transcriptional regulator
LTKSKQPQPTSKQRIIKAAAELFADRGYHAVGMTDLQQAVNLGRGSLYHHINSKEELLFDIVKVYIYELAEEADLAMGIKDPVRRLQALGAGLVEKITSHQAELTVCFREVQFLTEDRHKEVLGLHAKYEKVWKETYIEGAKSGVFREYDGIVLKGLLGMFYYSYLWIKPGTRMDTKTISDHLNDLSLRILKK